MTTMPIPSSYGERILEKYSQDAVATRTLTPWISTKDLSFRPDGSVRIETPDQNLIAQIGNRIQQHALRGMDLESHWSDYITQDIFALGADKINDEYRQSMNLFNIQGNFVMDVNTGDYEPIQDLSGKDVERLLRPDIKTVLDARGYSFDHYKELDFETSVNRLSRDILSISLDDSLTRSANTALERVAGGTVSFLTGFVDITTVVTAGTAGFAKKIGSTAIRSASENPLVRVAAFTAERFGRNQTISGALIDSRYTVEHASSFLGVDAMVMGGGIDLLSQYRENQILKKYYETPDAHWFSPEQFAASATMGWLLGKGLGKLFGIDNAIKFRQETITATVSKMVGDNPSPEAIRAAEKIVNGFWDDLSVPNFKDGDRSIEDVVDDMLDDYLTIYDGDLVDGKLRSTYLKELVVETLENAGGDLRGAKFEWRQAEHRINTAGKELQTLNRQRDRIIENLKGVVTVDGKPRPAPDDFHRELNRELFEEWSQMLQDVDQKILKAERDRIQGEEAIKKLQDREALAANADTRTIRENTANELLDFLKRSPSYDELLKFITDRNITPSTRAAKLTNELNRLAEVDSVVKRAAELADTPEGQLRVAFAAREAEAIEDRIPIYTTGKSGKPVTTQFEIAMELKQKARTLFNKAEFESDVKKRTKLLDQAIKNVDESNRLINEVRETSLRGVVDRQQRGAQFDTYLESNRVVPVSKRSQKEARAILEAHYLEAGNPPQLRNNNWINRILYSNIANNISGWGTPRAVMEQMIEDSPHMQSLINLLGDISHVSRSYDSSRSFVESIDTQRMRYNHHTDQHILAPLVELLHKVPDETAFNEKLKEAYRVAADLDSSNDPLVNNLAKGMQEVYNRVELEAVKQGMLRPNPKRKGSFVHVQAMPALAKDENARDTFINVYLEYLLNKHDPVKNPTDPTRRAVLAYSEVIAKKVKRSKDTEENVWAMRNLKVREGEEIVINLDGKDVTFKGEINNDLDTAHVDALFTRKNLSKLEHIDSEGKVHSVEDLYLNNFNDGMKLEATQSIDNLAAVSGRAEYSKGRVESPTNSSGKIRRANSSEARKIPLEVILDKRVLDTGMINLNPVLDAQHYWFSFGYDVYEQRQLNRLIGNQSKYGRQGISELTTDSLPTGVDFETFVDFAIDKHKLDPNTKTYTDKHYEDVKRFILHTRDALSGRNFIAHEQDGFTTGILQFIGQLASVGVNANVALMMPLTEIAMPTMLNVLGKRNRGLRMEALIRAFGGLNTKQRRAMGKALEMATLQHRVLADSGYYTDEIVLTFAQRFKAPFKRFMRAVKGGGTARSFRAATDGIGGRFANAAVAGAEILSETTRNLSGELIETAFGQGIFGRFHTSMVGYQMDNLVRAQALLSQFAGQPVDQKILKGIARKAGLDFGDMQDMIQAGILNYDVQPIGLGSLQLLSKAVKDWGDIDRVNAFINTLDVDQRRLTNDMFTRVLDYASRKTDRDITNPGVFDRPMHSANPVISVVHRFLSFSRGFRSGKMQELANAGIATAATGYVGYTLSELANRNLISIWSYGESWQDLADKWEENPGRMAIYTLGGVPYLGGGQSFANSILNTFSGDRFAPSYSPTMSLFSSNVRTMQKILDPKQEATEQDIRRALKMFPVLNHAAAAPLLNMALDEDETE